MNYTEYSIIVKFHYNLALFVNFDYARAKANLSILRLAFCFMYLLNLQNLSNYKEKLIKALDIYSHLMYDVHRKLNHTKFLCEMEF